MHDETPYNTVQDIETTSAKSTLLLIFSWKWVCRAGVRTAIYDIKICTPRWPLLYVDCHKML